uniref:Uncharacterized protein n=1 Tax=Lepeophtheirus salmonis TaxID=72036 RepID=A0A0K2VKK1_LEPSM
MIQSWRHFLFTIDPTYYQNNINFDMEESQ